MLVSEASTRLFLSISGWQTDESRSSNPFGCLKRQPSSHSSISKPSRNPPAFYGLPLFALLVIICLCRSSRCSSLKTSHLWLLPVCSLQPYSVLSASMHREAVNRAAIPCRCQASLKPSTGVMIAFPTPTSRSATFFRFPSPL